MSKNSNPSHTQSTIKKESAHIAVAGMGSAGLSAALYLLIAGHNVTLLDKRDSFTLSQRIIIPKSMTARFAQLDIQDPNVRLYFELLEKGIGLTTISEFEQNQYKLLTEISQNRKIQMRNGNCIPIRGQLTVHRGPQYEIEAVDGALQILILKSGHQIGFDHVIDATGSKRGVISALARSSNGAYQIEDDTSIPQAEHRANAILQFNSRIAVNRLNNSLMDTDYDLKAFQDKGWEEPYLPTFYLQERSGSENGDVYILAEIPDSLVGCQDPQKVYDFLKPIIEKNHPIAFANHRLDPKDVVLFSTFKIVHKISKTPYVKLGAGGYAIVIGDAMLPADFHFGHGVSKAILDSEILYHVFSGADQPKIALLDKRKESVKNNITLLQNIRYKTVQFCNFHILTAYQKVKFLMRLLFERQSLPILVKSVPLFFVGLAIGYPWLGFLAGAAFFSYTKYKHVIAEITYKTNPPANKQNTTEENLEQLAYKEGLAAEKTWGNYCLSYFHLNNYTHYHRYLQGRCAAKESNYTKFKL